MLCPHFVEKLKKWDFETIKCIFIGMESKELKGTSYMIINLKKLFLDAVLPLMKIPHSKLF